MKEDCIYWERGCGQPMAKPRYLRRDPTDLSFGSWCNYCNEYKPIPVEPDEVKHVVVYEHSDLNESNLRRLGELEGDVSGLKKGYHVHPGKKKKEQDYY